MYRFFKRFLDLCLSLICLLVLSPLMLILWIIIPLESKGSAVFSQTRLGVGAKEFKLYKFRSMQENSEFTGSGQYSFKGDPRVTRVGRLIRAFSLDELPQLVNVVKGDMSLIGPRPTLTYHPWTIDHYTEEQKKRFLVRPGLTGLAQVKGRKNLDWNKRIEYDVYYTEHISFLLDVKIFFTTIGKIVLRSDNQSKGMTVQNGTETEGKQC